MFIEIEVLICELSETRKHIYKSTRSKATGKGLNFGMRGGLLEVAQSGILGTLKEVERTKLYTWIETLEWMREQAQQRR
jgi:hypothetical protein